MWHDHKTASPHRPFIKEPDVNLTLVELNTVQAVKKSFQILLPDAVLSTPPTCPFATPPPPPPTAQLTSCWMKSSTAEPALTSIITRRGFFSFATISFSDLAPTTFVPFASLAKNLSTFSTVRLNAQTYQNHTRASVVSRKISAPQHGPVVCYVICILKHMYFCRHTLIDCRSCK